MKIINKTPNEIINIIKQDTPELDAVMSLAESVKVYYKGSVQQYQACVLYKLCKPYNGCNILEIGTGLGYSMSYIAQACPNSNITSIGVRPDETEHAKNIIHNNLGFKNVDFVIGKSWEYNNIISDPNSSQYLEFDVVFVDGDHARVQKDFVFWDRLNKGGLFVFHDYCPEYAANPQPYVYATLNTLKDKLGRKDFDVEIVDSDNIGMVGLYK